MKDDNRTKADLVRELTSLRRRVRLLEREHEPAADVAVATHAEESLSKYKFIASASQDFMTLINRTYVYEAANDAYCKAWGKTEAEIVGRRVAALWGDDTFKKNIKSHLDRCFS
jgi:PAS domain-containing protein